MSNIAVATAARRASRRRGYEADALDAALDRQAQAEDDAAIIERAKQADAEAEKIEAEKTEKAQAVLASGKVEELATAQARVEDSITEYIEAAEAAQSLRVEVEGARDTLLALGVEPPVAIPPALYLRATVGGDFLLRQQLEKFVRLAMARGES